MNLSDLKIECGKKGFNLSDSQIEQFETYIKLLQEWNEKMNLTAITEYNEIVEKHFFDSIKPLLDGRICGKLCDVGSGAGFPSIPMKIVDSTLDVTILEPLNKRCTFLNEVINKLNLNNIKVINKRSEEFVSEKRESFDIVIARAVANLSMLSELCIPHVKVGGHFIAMKGDKGIEELNEAKNAIDILGCEIESIDDYKISDFRRINLIYKKVKSTPSKYPRHFSKIKKNTL